MYRVRTEDVHDRTQELASYSAKGSDVSAASALYEPGARHKIGSRLDECLNKAGDLCGVRRAVGIHQHDDVAGCRGNTACQGVPFPRRVCWTIVMSGRRRRTTSTVLSVDRPSTTTIWSMPAGSLGSTSVMLNASLSIGITTLTVALLVNCRSGYTQGVTTSQTVTSTNLFMVSHIWRSARCRQCASDNYVGGTLLAAEGRGYLRSPEATFDRRESMLRATTGAPLTRDYPKKRAQSSWLGTLCSHAESELYVTKSARTGHSSEEMICVTETLTSNEAPQRGSRLRMDRCPQLRHLCAHRWRPHP